MKRLLGSLLAAALVSLVACGGEETAPPAGDDPLIQQEDGVDVPASEIATGGDGGGFCEAWDNVQQADDPPSAQHLQALRDTAPARLRDAVAMYVDVVEEHGYTGGLVSVMDFDQEMQLFSILDWYTQNCVGD